MNIVQLPIQDASGQVTMADALWLTLNPDQQVVVIGHPDPRSIELGNGGDTGVDSLYIGRLSEQNFIFRAQIINSLDLQGWDFERYNDPEIVLLTRINDGKDK